MQIGVFQKFHGVKAVLRSVMESRRFGRYFGREIGGDVVLPEAEARKNVRRHVQRMRHLRRDLRIVARGVESVVSLLGIVAGVNDVVGDSRMVRMLAKQGLEN